MGKRVSGPALLFLTLAFSLITGDVLVLARQDPQTQPATPQTQPTPTTKTRTSKRKRGQMKKTTPTTDTTTADQTTTTPADTPTAAQTAMPAQTTTASQNMASTQTDLSGTYTGTFNCDALGLAGDTTLTVNGNEFSTADGKTGRIVASTTHGYTAVALQTGDVSTAAATTPGAATTTAPQIVSLRARKSGNRLTLMPVSGTTMQCSFMPSRNIARTRRSRQRTPAATGTEVSSPASMPNPTETPAQPTQPTPESPMPSQTPSPTPGPSPSPGASPSPSPSGSPEPSPGSSPMPSPTPSPSPRPRG